MGTVDVRSFPMLVTAVGRLFRGGFIAAYARLIYRYIVGRRIAYLPGVQNKVGRVGPTIYFHDRGDKTRQHCQDDTKGSKYGYSSWYLHASHSRFLN